MKKVVFTFARMNPPTCDHETLVNRVSNVARSQSATPRVYLSHTENNATDPLPYPVKMDYAKKAFGNIVTYSESATIIDVMKQLEDEGFTEATMIVGSDKVESIRELLETYNGKEYDFKDINVFSGGVDDPDDNLSADMRSAALAGNMQQFMEFAPSRLDENSLKELAESIHDTLFEEAINENIVESDNLDDRFQFFLSQEDALRDLMESQEQTQEEPEAEEEEAEEEEEIDELQEDLLEEPEEHGDQRMAGFASVLLHARTVTHLMHLRARKYATHKALEYFYNNIPKLVDAVVESYQGKYGMLVDYPDTYKVVSDDPVNYLEQLNAFVSNIRVHLPQDSEIQNDIDAIVSLINQTLYQLKYLN